MSDPAIWVTESVYIQVGMDYVVVFKNGKNGLSMYRCSLSIDDIFNKLKKAIEE